VLAALLLFASCGDEDALAPPADTGPLRAAIARERLFEATRAFELALQNTGPDPIETTDARLRSNLFEPVDPDGRVATVWPTGDPVTMPLRFGPAVCGGEDSITTVELTVDGRPSELAIDRVPDGILAVHERECAAAEVRQVVDLTFADDWQITADGLAAGTIVVDRLGPTEVVVEEIDPASVVFTVEVPSGRPASDEIDLVVAAGRCDAHALIESKKLFHFRIWVRVDGGDRVAVELEASAGGPARTALEQVLEACTSAR